MEPEIKILLFPSIVIALPSYETSTALIAKLIKAKHSNKIAIKELVRPIIATPKSLLWRKKETIYECNQRVYCQFIIEKYGII